MSQSPMVGDPTSLFAEHIQFLTSFNPDFHLDDSYLQVHHPEHIPGLFSRRASQLAIVGENSPLSMDPLNWRYMYRPNRPFHFITNEPLRASIPKLPPRPWLERERKEKPPTRYYQEQMEMMNAPPLVIEEPEVMVESGPSARPLKLLVNFLGMILGALAWMMLVASAMMFGLLAHLRDPVVRAYRRKGGLKGEIVLFALVAVLVVKLLPGLPRFEGEESLVGVNVMRRNAPLYVMMIRNPNQFVEGAMPSR